MLDIGSFAESVIGLPGDGLNLEQRRLVSIGVELAAKPELLLFLDEPTSGLDSQSALAILRILRSLADMGMAIIATIHQPSYAVFQQFDRLLLLAKGGRTVYFGDVGEDSETVLKYFESNGARPCETSENPAEYLLEVVIGTKSAANSINWVEKWEHSIEKSALYYRTCSNKNATLSTNEDSRLFPMPWYIQLALATKRVAQYHWRTPAYVWAKIALGVLAALYYPYNCYFHWRENLT